MCIPVQLSTTMRRQHPVTSLEQSRILQKLAEVGSMPTIFKCVCSKKHWLGTTATASDARVNILTICIIWTCVVYKSLNGRISGK